MDSRGVVSAVALVILALSVLLAPLQWVLAMLLSAAFHELCHYLMIRICGGEVAGFRVGSGGARMEVRGLTPGKELICALAGPLGGLCLLFLARWIPRTAICAGCHSLFNLLPVYPLDGGRALRCVMGTLLSPPMAERVCGIIEKVCLGGIALLGIYGCFVLRLGSLPLLVSGLAVIRGIQGKIPCKPEIDSLQ